MLRIELPFPPSVNTYWGTRVIQSKNSRRAIVQRFVNGPGKQFKAAVLQQLMIERVNTKFEGPIVCTVDLYPPCNRKRDCDNYCKGLLDSLGEAGLYHDDSQIVDLRIRMHPKQAPGKTVVTLTAAQDFQSAHNQPDWFERNNP